MLLPVRTNERTNQPTNRPTDQPTRYTVNPLEQQAIVIKINSFTTVPSASVA
jgi:hypothetical protein